MLPSSSLLLTIIGYRCLGNPLFTSDNCGVILSLYPSWTWSLRLKFSASISLWRLGWVFSFIHCFSSACQFYLNPSSPPLLLSLLFSPSSSPPPLFFFLHHLLIPLFPPPPSPLPLPFSPESHCRILTLVTSWMTVNEQRSCASCPTQKVQSNYTYTEENLPEKIVTGRGRGWFSMFSPRSRLVQHVLSEVEVGSTCSLWGRGWFSMFSHTIWD